MDANEENMKNNLNRLVEEGIVDLQALMGYTEDFNLGPYNPDAEDRT